MKSLKLRLANTSSTALLLALPLFTILPCLSSAAAPNPGQYDMARRCYRGVNHAWLMSEERGTPINVRDDASTQAYARHIGYAGDEVAVMNRTMGDDGYCWYRVKFESKATGWVRGDHVSLDLGE